MVLKDGVFTITLITLLKQYFSSFFKVKMWFLYGLDKVIISLNLPQNNPFNAPVSLITYK